jgi:sigma-B regulation protein RsbU (phosphoserine phosphatase)
LGPTGPVVGAIPNASFAIREVSLKEGDLLLAFTDGITVALNSANEPLGRDRLSKLVQSADRMPDELLQAIAGATRRHVGPAKQFDDITKFAVRRSMPSP